MPYHVGSADSCPSDKPHAVIKDSDGEVMGCHATEDDAKRQMAALYAQDSLTPAGAKMERKSFGLIEAKADKDTGTFEATGQRCSATSTSGGDRIQPGAFTKSLERWNADRRPDPGDPVARLAEPLVAHRCGRPEG
jgi:hypothetical protein